MFSTPLMVAGFIVVIGIAIPIAIVAGRIVFNLLNKLGVSEPVEKCDRVKVDNIKKDLLQFTELHIKLKRDIRRCSNTDYRILRKECGDEIIDTFDS